MNRITLGLLLLIYSTAVSYSQFPIGVKTVETTLHLDVKATLGEGAIFDYKNKIFYWIDIEQGTLYWCNKDAEDCSSFSFGKRIGTVVPTDQKAIVAIALEDGIYYFNLDTKEIKLICSPEKDKKGNRFNDGKCSPAGNFWVGSMSLYGRRFAGSLYRVKSNGEYVTMIDSVGISNGLVWNADHTKMYFIDTPTSKIIEFDYNPVLDTITSPRVCINIPAGIGNPDGMSIDTEDKLWVAHYGGSGIYRWDPKSGELLLKLAVPAKNVTSCAFAGNKQETLFITTARDNNSAENLQSLPYSGGLFKAETGILGQSIHYFKTLP